MIVDPTDVYLMPAGIPTGFILAFTRGWDMTLVMLGCIPFMGLMGALMTRSTAKAAERENKAYAKASGVAQQSISQIRTVASYTQV
jgi:ATP-binding cassette subfamily B (MDR/TAP) protein 1